MFVLLEVDRKTSWGIEFVWPRLFGFRAGWIAVHVAFVPYYEMLQVICDHMNKKKAEVATCKG